jgi:hypothetical protein
MKVEVGQEWKPRQSERNSSITFRGRTAVFDEMVSNWWRRDFRQDGKTMTDPESVAHPFCLLSVC